MPLSSLQLTAFTDAVSAAIWVAANGLMIGCLVRLHRHLFPQDDDIHRGLFGSLAFIATLVLAGTILGAIGQLTAIGQLLLALTILVGLDKVFRPRDLFGQTACQRPPEPRQPWNLIRWMAILMLVAHSTVNGVMRFPTDFDSLWYHMPLIDSWLQTGSLYAPDCARWYFPANSELIGVWATAGCSGDFLVPFNNVPIMILWGFATLSIFQSLGVSVGWNYSGTAGVLAVYTTIHETIDASNDLMVVACFSAAVAMILKSGHITDIRSERIRILLIGVATGLLAGTKHFALGYALGATCLLLLHSTGTVGLTSAARSVLSSSLCSLPFCAGWYLRNWWFTGFPLFPVGAPAASGEMAYPDLWSTTIMGNGSPHMIEHLTQAVWEKCGPVHIASLALIPVTTIGLLLSALQPDNRSQRRAAFSNAGVIVAAVFGCLLVWLVTPYCVEDEPGSLNHLIWAYTPIRYGLCFLAMSVIAAVTLMASLPVGRIDRLMQAMMLTVVAIQWIHLIKNHSHQLQPVLQSILAVDGLIVGLLFVRAFKAGRVRRAAAVIALTIAVTSFFGWISGTWHTGLANHFQNYTGLQFFQRLDREQTASRILVLDQRSYPYFGSARQHRVVQPSGFRSLSQVRDLINRHQPRYVITRSRPEYTVYPYEAAWLQMANIEGLKLLESTSELRVYEQTGM